MPQNSNALLAEGDVFDLEPGDTVYTQAPKTLLAENLGGDWSLDRGEVELTASGPLSLPKSSTRWRKRSRERPMRSGTFQPVIIAEIDLSRLADPKAEFDRAGRLVDETIERPAELRSGESRIWFPLLERYECTACGASVQFGSGDPAENLKRIRWTCFAGGLVCKRCQADA